MKDRRPLEGKRQGCPGWTEDFPGRLPAVEWRRDPGMVPNPPRCAPLWPSQLVVATVVIGLCHLEASRPLLTHPLWCWRVEPPFPNLESFVRVRHQAGSQFSSSPRGTETTGGGDSVQILGPVDRLPTADLSIIPALVLLFSWKVPGQVVIVFKGDTPRTTS